MQKLIDLLGIPKLTGEEWQARREKAGLTQRQFSDRTGIPIGTLRRWEQHASKISKGDQLILEKLFEIIEST